MMRRNVRALTLVVPVALILAACGGGGGGSKASPARSGSDTKTTSETKGPDLPECPLDALAKATKPVQITMWHAMTRAPEDELKKLTSEFNASQTDIQVTLSGAPSYSDELTRYKAGLGTGELPDLYQGDDTGLQVMIDSGGVLPVQSCLTADKADTSDFVPRIKQYYTVKDVLWPMPFNVSNPILYYNKSAFEKAGLDPNAPPKTLEEIRSASQKLVDSGATKYGIALKTDTVFFEHSLAKSGHTLVDNGNGRTDRATKVTFDDATGVSLFTWLNDMVNDKLALSTGSASGTIDHYLAVANGQAAMTIDSSASLGTISLVLGSGQFPNVKLGAGPMPGPASAKGGVLVGGAALYLMNKSAPEKQAAAYQFAKFLTTAQTQSEWAAATGYVPVKKSSATMSPLKEKYEQSPDYKVAYDQLLAGAENDATAGAVIGAYGAKGSGVRGAVIDALDAMYTEHTPPKEAVKQAADAANAAIQDYNDRVG